MATVEVPGVVEATESATFDHRGQPVYLRGNDHGRQGSLIRAGHPIVAAHPELFRPLVLELDFDDDR